MLLETGRLSTSGYAIKENVPRSWRRGIELCLAWEPLSWLKLDGNTTLSMNQIAQYTSYVPYEDYSALHEVNYGRTTMLMSPSVIAMARASFLPWKGGRISVDFKYVGKQYIDNSMREQMAIPAWWVANLQMGHQFKLPLGLLDLSVYVNNLFNRMYYAAGWRWETYNPASDTVESGIGVYPQAPCNFMIKLRFSF